jgi:hypothetical protein
MRVKLGKILLPSRRGVTGPGDWLAVHAEAGCSPPRGRPIDGDGGDDEDGGNQGAVPAMPQGSKASDTGHGGRAAPLASSPARAVAPRRHVPECHGSTPLRGRAAVRMGRCRSGQRVVLRRDCVAGRVADQIAQLHARVGDLRVDRQRTQKVPPLAQLLLDAPRGNGQAPRSARAPGR